MHGSAPRPTRLTRFGAALAVGAASFSGLVASWLRPPAVREPADYHVPPDPAVEAASRLYRFRSEHHAQP